MNNYLNNRTNCLDPNNYDDPSCACIICTHPQNDSSIETPCGHFYHYECLNTWFISRHSPVCPICKRTVPYVTDVNKKQIIIEIPEERNEYDLSSDDEDDDTTHWSTRYIDSLRDARYTVDAQIKNKQIKNDEDTNLSNYSLAIK
jgi:hypothetical protein